MVLGARVPPATSRRDPPPRSACWASHCPRFSRRGPDHRRSFRVEPPPRTTSAADGAAPPPGPERRLRELFGGFRSYRPRELPTSCVGSSGPPAPTFASPRRSWPRRHRVRRREPGANVPSPLQLMARGRRQPKNSAQRSYDAILSTVCVYLGTPYFPTGVHLAETSTRVVGVDARGCESQNARQQLTLAARPLEERRWRRTIMHVAFLRSVNRWRRASKRHRTAHPRCTLRHRQAQWSSRAARNFYGVFCCFLFRRTIFLFRVLGLKQRAAQHRPLRTSQEKGDRHGEGSDEVPDHPDDR